MSKPYIKITISNQELDVYDGDTVIFNAKVSTARNGAGETFGSECTPRGKHIIRAMIGQDCPPGTVFVGRRPTGEIYSPGMQEQFPNRDWILTRILWLSGCEPGKNRLGEVDTMRRFIYIHGCPDELPIGIAGSHGCIRMHNEDIVRLYDMVQVGSPVVIEE